MLQRIWQDEQTFGVAPVLSTPALRSDGSPSAHATGNVTDPKSHGDISHNVPTEAVRGDVGGLLAALGLVAIPGLGSIVAAGGLAATAAGAGLGAIGGAATGTIVGALKYAGHTENEVNVYSEGVRRGGTLVSARVDDTLSDLAEAALESSHGIDDATRGSAHRKDGWERFDEKAPVCSRDDVNRESSLYGAGMRKLAKTSRRPERAAEYTR